MATLTGVNLLGSVIESSGAEVNMLINATLGAKLQQMLDNSTYSKLAAAIAISGFSTTINDATQISELSDAIETNTALIAAAVDTAAVEAIDFPPIGDPGLEYPPSPPFFSSSNSFLEQVVDLELMGISSIST